MTRIAKYLLIVAVVMVACNKSFSVDSIIVYPGTVSTVPNDTIQLSFAMQYSGGDFDDKNLIQPLWESSDNNVVEVDSRGRIVTKSVGNATVTMSCGGAVGMCNVTVEPELEEPVPR